MDVPSTLLIIIKLLQCSNEIYHFRLTPLSLSTIIYFLLHFHHTTKVTKPCTGPRNQLKTSHIWLKRQQGQYGNYVQSTVVIKKNSDGTHLRGEKSDNKRGPPDDSTNVMKRRTLGSETVD